MTAAADLTVFTVVRGFAVNSAVPLDFLVELRGALQRCSTFAEAPTKKRPQHRDKTSIGHRPTVARQVPRQLYHRNDRAEMMKLVEVVTVDGYLVLKPG